MRRAPNFVSAACAASCQVAQEKPGERFELHDRRADALEALDDVLEAHAHDEVLRLSEQHLLGAAFSPSRN